MSKRAISPRHPESRSPRHPESRRDEGSSFEENLAHLQKLVQSLENGQLSLEDSLKQFEEGVKLSRLCQSTLKEAQVKMEKCLKENQINIADNVVDEPDETL